MLAVMSSYILRSLVSGFDILVPFYTFVKIVVFFTLDLLDLRQDFSSNSKRLKKEVLIQHLSLF